MAPSSMMLESGPYVISLQPGVGVYTAVRLTALPKSTKEQSCVIARDTDLEVTY